jgi:hypothetical protein
MTAIAKPHVSGARLLALAAKYREMAIAEAVPFVMEMPKRPTAPSVRRRDAPASGLELAFYQKKSPARGNGGATAADGIEGEPIRPVNL